MKNFLLLIFLLFSVEIVAQLECAGEFNELINDELPDCISCESRINGNTTSYTADSFSFDFPCGVIEKSQWVSIIANSDRKLLVTLKYGFCNRGSGVEGALYDKDLNLISNCGTATLIDPEVLLIAENVTPGETYHLMVDGIDGADCGFIVDFEGNLDSEISQLFDLVIDETKSYCFGDEMCFSVGADVASNNFLWDTPNGLEILSGGGLRDTFICFRVNKLGTVYAFAKNACKSWHKSHNIDDFIDLDKLSFADTIMCSSACLFFNDSCYSKEGRHQIFFENLSGSECREVLTLDIEHREILPSPEVICQVLGNTLRVEWSEINGAKDYIISLDRDSFTTTSDNFINIENIQPTESINVKVQPIGACDYLPAEINCSVRTSNANDNSSKINISIFPNPTIGLVTIETDLKVDEIDIYDFSGRLLQTEFDTIFDMKKFGTGIYFLKIKTNEGVNVKRVVVN